MGIEGRHYDLWVESIIYSTHGGLWKQNLKELKVGRENTVYFIVLGVIFYLDVIKTKLLFFI